MVNKHTKRKGTKKGLPTAPAKLAELNFKTGREAAVSTLRTIEKFYAEPEKGIPLKVFPDPGLQKGTLTLVCSLPSQGKTAYLVNLVSELDQAGLSTAVFLLDATMGEFTSKLFSVLSGVDYSGLRHGKLPREAWPKLTTAAEQISRSGIYFSGRGKMTDHEISEDVRKLAAALKKEGRSLGAVVIDSLHYLDEENCLNTLWVLRELAQSLNIPVMCALGLQETKNLKNGWVSLGDLRAVGVDEAHVDLVLNLRRPAYFERDYADKELTEILCVYAKERRSSSLLLKFKHSTQAFTRPDPQLTEGD